MNKMNARRRSRSSGDGIDWGRRRFLKTAVQAGALVAVPQIVPGSALGKGGTVAPSERITLGAIGIGNRGRLKVLPG